MDTQVSPYAIDKIGLLKEWGFFKKGARVLDVGCSDGRFVLPIMKDPIKYHGFDVQEKRIKMARRCFRFFPNFHFKHVPINNDYYSSKCTGISEHFYFPYVDSCFDNVLCVSLFTHLGTESAALNYMNNVKRVIKPGGLLYITFFSNPPNKVDQYDVSAEGRTIYSMDFIDELTDGFAILHVEDGKTTYYNDQLKLIARRH